MKYFDPDNYARNVAWVEEAQDCLVYTFWVGDANSMRPFPKGSRPWVPIEKYNEDGMRLYSTTAIIDYILPAGSVVRVPKGFEWDGASIPKWAQWLIGKPMGKYALSALLHDWLYASRILGDNPHGRLKADQLFNICLKQQKVAKWRRLAMYRAVRLGGSHAYHNSDETFECRKLMDPHIDYNPFTDYFIYP